MNLLLDCGNTRLKWAISGSGAGTSGQSSIIRRGICNYEPADLGALCEFLNDASIKSLQFASVVSPVQEQAIFAQLEPLGLVPQRFSVSGQSGRLVNAYSSPETLGVDRWAAAIGAWGLIGGPCLIISAGTATTIDVVQASLASSQGVYRGGLILPGIDLMLQSLHERAARLPRAEGHYRAAPDIADNTHDAITSGAIEATCGAIERMGHHLPDDAPWLLTGGNASTLQTALGDRVRIVDDLVLEGLAAFHTPISI